LNRSSPFLHAGLFLLTFLTTTLAGVQWLNKDPLELSNFPFGLPYSLLLLLMLSAHEFGHYVAARLHGVDATLPYYLPFPSFLFGIGLFGTFGAVIRVRSAIPSRKALFDIGASGPIAGFVVTLIILIIGLRTLPPIDYLYGIHPEYAKLAAIPQEGLTFGHTLLYDFLVKVCVPAGTFVPPMNEIYHYPFLCVGWFGMFVTAMNLLPIGQLDGGHITFAMFGDLSHRIGQATLILLVVLGTLGFLPLVGIPFSYGWTGWLFWAIILVIFLRRSLLARPMPKDASCLSLSRFAIGWACGFVFIASFIPAALSFVNP
jgi:membrane-associated protease RseP (regulator of RpoE activity)